MVKYIIKIPLLQDPVFRSPISDTKVYNQSRDPEGSPTNFYGGPF